jgi:hypothetical protein
VLPSRDLNFNYHKLATLGTGLTKNLFINRLPMQRLDFIKTLEKNGKGQQSVS